MMMMMMTSQGRCYASRATAFATPPWVVVLLCLRCTGMCGMFWGSLQVTAVWFVSTVTAAKPVYIANRGFPEAPRSSSAAAVSRRTCSGRDRSVSLLRRSRARLRCEELASSFPSHRRSLIASLPLPPASEALSEWTDRATRLRTQTD